MNIPRRFECKPFRTNQKGAAYSAAPIKAHRSTCASTVLVAGHQPMRIAVKVLGGKFEQLGVLDRFHLMH